MKDKALLDKGFERIRYNRKHQLLPDTELTKDIIKCIFICDLTSDLAKVV